MAAVPDPGRRGPAAPAPEKSGDEASGPATPAHDPHPKLRRSELGEILHIAVPLAAAQIAQVVMTTTDAIMMGRVSTESLAAGGLGSSVTVMLLFMTQGLLQSIQPIVAQGRGARDTSDFARTLAGGLVAATLAAIPIILMMVGIKQLLLLMHEPPGVADLTQVYALALAWGVPASLWQAVLRNYLSAMARTRIIFVVSCVACVVNLGLNWVMIFGHFGVPALGLAGSGYATATVWWGMGIALALYCHRARLLPPGIFRQSAREIRRGFHAVVSLGWPVAAIAAMEVGMFTGSSLLVGLFGPVALAAHQICVTLCSLFFMVPMAIGVAATVRVGYHIGAGSVPAARRAGWMAIGLGVGFMVISALSMRLLAQPIFGLYLNETDPDFAAVAALGRQLLVLAALFQVFDGAQTVTAGALRGLKDVHAPLLAGLTGYWLTGLPVGIGLAFFGGAGPVGLWWGFVAGLTSVAIMLVLRFRQRIGQMMREHAALA